MYYYNHDFTVNRHPLLITIRKVYSLECDKSHLKDILKVLFVDEYVLN